MHEHEKHSSCGCNEHEHEHHEEHSCCHEHEHKHHKKHSCCDKHEHGHSHESDSCGCGCGCGEHENSKSYNIMLILGIIALIASVVLKDSLIGVCLAGIGTVLGGIPLFIAGAKELSRLKFGELGLLTIAVAASFALALFGDDPFDYLFEAAMVTVLFRLGEYLEDMAIEKSRRAIADATAIRPDTARVLINGEECIVPADEVEVGSVIVLHPGERAAIDCEVISGEAFADCSAVTGEPLPVSVGVGDVLLSGSVDTDGLLTCKTVAKFSDSTASRILKLVEEASETRGETEAMISRFAAVYTPVVLVMAAVLAFVPPMLGLGSLMVWVPRALIFLVASCPCAFVIAVPLTFLSGIGAISRKGVLIKGTIHLEILAHANSVIFDKTGTLTSGVPKVTDFAVLNGADREEVLALAYIAEKNSDHPAAKAVCEYCGERDMSAADNFREVPGRGVELTVNGKKVLCGSASLLSQNGVAAPDGYAVYLAVGDTAVGGFALTDTPREDAARMAARFKKMGFDPIGMLTGDSQANADIVSRELGLDFAMGQLMPQDKASQVSAVRNGGKCVIFVGDGINDAPVLAAADVGFAMGLGTDAAIETADGVLMSEKLESLADAVALSRQTVRKARENIAFALIVKFAVLLLGVFGLAQMWMAVFADVGVTLIAVLNAASLLRNKN